MDGLQLSPSLPWMGSSSLLASLSFSGISQVVSLGFADRMAPKFSKMEDPNPKKKIQARPGM